MTSADGAGPRGPWGAAVDRLGPVVATFCLLVVLAAGGSAVALLAAPGSTDRYFSWTLRPDAAAAMIGGMYLASAAVFAWALTLPWPQVRPLFVGVVGLTTPTFVLTVIHNEVFDYGRWQAVVWFLLFCGAPVSAVLILATTHRGVPSGHALEGWVRVVLAVLSAALAVLAVALWVEAWRDDVSRAGPVDLLGLTGSYLGAWCSFAGCTAGWAAFRGTWDDARLPIVAVGAVAVGLTVAFLRTLDDLRHPAAAVATTSALFVGAICLYVVVDPARRRRTSPTSSPHPGASATGGAA
jgi:hypothetical protein